LHANAETAETTRVETVVGPAETTIETTPNAITADNSDTWHETVRILNEVEAEVEAVVVADVEAMIHNVIIVDNMVILQGIARIKEEMIMKGVVVERRGKSLVIIVDRLDIYRGIVIALGILKEILGRSAIIVEVLDIWRGIVVLRTD